MTTVLLAHRHPAIRAWLRSALARASEVEFVAEVSTGEEAVSLAEQIRCGVALVSYTLPGEPPGIEAAERIREAGPDVPVLALGVPGDDELLCRLASRQRRLHRGGCGAGGCRQVGASCGGRRPIVDS